MNGLDGFLSQVPGDVLEYASEHTGKIAWLGVVSRLPYQLLLRAERLGFETAIEAILERAKADEGRNDEQA
jgi:hypothetical protein